MFYAKTLKRWLEPPGTRVRQLSRWAVPYAGSPIGPVGSGQARWSASARSVATRTIVKR